jgi:hypothetical protein
LSNDQSTIIARRSVSLSKTYPIIGIVMALLGLLISSLSGTIANLPTNVATGNATGASGLKLASALPFIAVPLQAFAAVIFATPVLLLFVYDKNNGVLEYFLSLGMTQGDVYRRYLKAALILASAIVGFDVVIDLAAGLILGSGSLMLEVSGLVVSLALPVVCFATLIMMSFSSLQKQRVGSNQPLGMAIGVFIVMPSYIGPLILPSFALAIDLLLAGVIIFLSLLTYLSSSRLISREKLLP